MKPIAPLLVALSLIASTFGQSLPPLTVSLEQDQNGDTWVIHNNSRAAITLIAFVVDLASTQTRYDYFDAAISQGMPVQPGGDGRFNFHNGGRPAEAQFRCAIFADGTTYGEFACLESALKRRRETLGGLEILIRQFSQENLAKVVTCEQLKRMLSSSEFIPPADVDEGLRTAISNVNLWVERKLLCKESAGQQPEQVNVAEVVAMLKAWHDELAKSRLSLIETAPVAP